MINPDDEIEKIVSALEELPYDEVEEQLRDAFLNDNVEINRINVLIELQKKFYWNIMSLDLVLIVTQVAREFHTQKKGSPQQLSPVLYNLASFTCPWWSDSLGITDEHAEVGLKVAEELVQLRKDHDFETIKQAGGLWILGGHYLYTLKDFEKTVNTYEQVNQLANSVPEEKLSPVLQGNSIEGQGRAYLMLKHDRKAGMKLIEQSKQLYKDADDDYSLSEVEKFVETYESTNN